MPVTFVIDDIPRVDPYNGLKCKRCGQTKIAYHADYCPKCGCKTLWLDESKDGT